MALSRLQTQFIYKYHLYTTFVGCSC